MFRDPMVEIINDSNRSYKVYDSLLRESKDPAVEELSAILNDINETVLGYESEITELQRRIQVLEERSIKATSDLCDALKIPWTDEAKRLYTEKFGEAEFYPWALPSIGQRVFVRDHSHVVIGIVTSFLELNPGWPIRNCAWVKVKDIHKNDFSAENVMLAFEALEDVKYTQLVNIRELRSV